jgi:7,8-dihydropterin-6-yl-methyl-4-(beta-D-ribofuranosyl)aminobenzene 5'-phosphate synthase
VDGDYRISDDLMLFTTPSTEKYRSSANNTLYSGPKKDDFSHEHNLMIFGETDVLVIGCGHAGVVNIMERAAEYNPKVCVGGFHLWNPMTKKTVPGKILNGISQELSKYDVRFYTCHCTGQKAFDYLAGRLSNMRYLHCGETIEL